MTDTVNLGFRRRRIRRLAVVAGLSMVVLVLCCAALYLGNTQYPPDVIIRVILGEQIKGASFAIGTLRLPRMLIAVLAGMAFGMAGNTFQTMLGNPLASPDIIGVTAGCSVAAVFCITFLNVSKGVISLAAVVTGVALAAIIYFLSYRGGFSGPRLILIGIGIQAMLNALTYFLLLRANQYDVPAAMRWLSGSLNGLQMKDVPLLFGVVTVFGFILTALSKYLNILELGDQSATSLGVRTDRVRMLMVICAVFLIAYTTAVTGPVAFVSFLAGPIASRLAGRGNSNIVPSALTGAALVLLADIVGQNLFDIRFPVGVVTGMLGAPYLVFLLIRMNKGGAA
ncbi:FecCD family ABC transporter permease [Thermoclostridium caenicola]|uniref:Iron complex transport system permease protein n=1 Tax=Thermoclostridium caenicola TaxID=659425 RepID=A0A1M6JEX6_9FIRM|nr:iron ABC transporter permease [Thermoclostridium caenicola]SHJ45237.1 iron complex transport system permease protein [Thermoclostridium caenicola]